MLTSEVSPLPVATSVPVSVASFTQATLPALSTSNAEHPRILAEWGTYRARLATTEADRRNAFRLRFLVFNLELNEGLESAYADGYDTDRFDAVCDHLLVEHTLTGNVVGTYRMQSGETAALHHGYYSEQEFDFAPYEAMRLQIVELGRACVHRDHRSSEVLNLLWKGVVRYARKRDARYLMGCCSLTSQDAAEGWAVFEHLRAYMVEPVLVSTPRTAFTLPVPEEELPALQPPKLLRAYLALGAWVCAEPAIDREFSTIDFLTMLDLETLHPRVLRRFA